jgi:hypothetical protein
MARKSTLLLRAIALTAIVGFSFEASALPLSPKWMKSNESIKRNQPTTSGELPDNTGTGGGGVQALPAPASLWLIFAGVAAFAVQRKKTI